MLGVVRGGEAQFHALTLSRGCGVIFTSKYGVKFFATILSKIVAIESWMHENVGCSSISHILP